MSKKFLYRVIPLLTVVCLVIAVSVPVFAAESSYSKINIVDYLTSKEYLGDDVKLSYDIPVAPYTEIKGFTSAGKVVQLPSSTHVNFYNDKIYVTEPGELLFNWDFTNSLTDTVSGVSAVLKSHAGIKPSLQSDGVHFTDYGGALILNPGGNETILNKTVEIDFVSTNFTDTNPRGARIFSLCPTGRGNNANEFGSSFCWLNAPQGYRDKVGWTLDSALSYGYYSVSDALDPSVFSVNMFSGKTVRLVFDALGYCTLSYADLGSTDFIEVQTFNVPLSNFGATSGELSIGPGAIEDFSCIISGVRIRENEKQILVNKYESMSFEMWMLGESNAADLRVIDLSDIRSGSQYDLTLEFDNRLSVNGSLNFPRGTQFMFWYLDSKYEVVDFTIHSLDLQEGILTDGGEWSYTFSNIVPDGTKYLYFTLDCQHLETSNAEDFQWVITHMKLSCMMSAIEDNSQMLEEIQDKLDEIISGSPGANAGADNMQDVAGDYKDHVNDQLQDGQAQMDKLEQLPRPDVSGVVTLPEWATSDQFLGFNAVVATVWENETIYEIMVVASILMLASYILFGKKV